jgi:hypothetical protein
MKFLSSKEAVALVGVKMEDVPGHKRRKSAMSGQETPGSGSGTRRGSEAGDLPPPSWEQLDRERRQSEAFERRNLATPVQMGRELASESPATPEIGTPGPDGITEEVPKETQEEEEPAKPRQTTSKTEPAETAVATPGSKPSAE